MSLVNVINKVLKFDKDYNISKLGDNGVEFSAPGLYMGNFVLYDCEKNFIFLQGSLIEYKEDVTGLGWEEIAEKIIFKLDWRKRLGAIIYQPEDEKKELFYEKIKYEGKADITKSEILGECFIEKNPSRFSEYYTNTKGVELRFDFIGHPMYDDKYYRRTEYKPRKEVQDGLGNYYCHSDIDNSKVEIYDAEPFMKLERWDTNHPFKYEEWRDLEPYQFSISWYFDENGQLLRTHSNNNVIIKQITPDIQHITTPSKNYFLFKLS
jgi:hypothetical protein